jgi:hypothetical protein
MRRLNYSLPAALVILAVTHLLFTPDGSQTAGQSKNYITVDQPFPTSDLIYIRKSLASQLNSGIPGEASLTALRAAKPQQVLLTYDPHFQRLRFASSTIHRRRQAVELSSQQA